MEIKRERRIICLCTSFPYREVSNVRLTDVAAFEDPNVTPFLMQSTISGDPKPHDGFAPSHAKPPLASLSSAQSGTAEKGAARINHGIQNTRIHPLDHFHILSELHRFLVGPRTCTYRLSELQDFLWIQGFVVTDPWAARNL